MENVLACDLIQYKSIQQPPCRFLIILSERSFKERFYATSTVEFFCLFFQILRNQGRKTLNARSCAKKSFHSYRIVNFIVLKVILSFIKQIQLVCNELRMTMNAISYKNFGSVSHFDQRLKKQFTDCFLVAEGQSIACHRVIVAKMSPFFERLLLQHVTHHPIIILSEDVTYQDLQDILNLIYTGRCEVSGERLKHFMDVGHKLEIIGMRQNDDNNNQACHPSFETTLTRQVDTSEMPPQAAPAKAKPKKLPAIPRKLSIAVPKKQRAPAAEANYQCIHCAQLYKKGLAIHIRECLFNPNRVLVQCQICSMNLKPSQLTKHMDAHKKAAA